MAKTVKCNNCGAIDLEKVSDNEYKCNYCQARTVTGEPKFDVGSFFKTFNPNDLHKRTQTTYTSDQTVIKNTSKLGCLIGMVILLTVLGGILVPIILTVKESVTAAENHTWKLSYTQQVYYAVGSKGPVAWVFQEENYNWEKNRSVLKIIDPVTKKTLYTEIVVPEHTSSETVAGIWDLFNGGRVFGDTIFFTPKAKGLEGRNIYTSKKVLDQSYFNKKIGTELAEASAYNSSNESFLRIKSADGVDYCYFPKQDKIITHDAFYKRDRERKMQKYFFVLSGNTDKKYVTRVREMADESDMTSSYHQSYSDYRKDPKYYNKYYEVSSVDSVPVDHGFFNAEFLSTNDSVFVIKYKANLMEDTPWVIGSFDVHGKNHWKIIPSTFTVFKGDKKDKVDLTTSKINGQLIITTNSGFKAACAINLQTGKTDWTFRIDK